MRQLAINDCTDESRLIIASNRYFDDHDVLVPDWFEDDHNINPETDMVASEISHLVARLKHLQLKRRQNLSKNVISHQGTETIPALTPREPKPVQNSDDHAPHSRRTDILTIFESWNQSHRVNLGAPTTSRDWKRVILKFQAFSGITKIEDLSAESVRSFRDSLLDEGLSAKTVGGTYLAALKAMVGHACELNILKDNPLMGVRMKRNRFQKSHRMSSMTDKDALIILAAALKESRPLFRFVPWLLASTGSRVSSMVNLRGCDVSMRAGLPILRITREAGPVKTAESEREIPCPQALLDMGFLEFAASRGEGRLFYDDQEPFAGATYDLVKYNPGRLSLKHLTNWVHRLGLDIGRSLGTAPNHAWRHWFREKAVEAGIHEKVTDAIVGHAPTSSGRAYGGVKLATMKEAMNQIPLPMHLIKSD